MIEAMFSLESHDLKLNPKKCQIISDRKEMDGIQELGGIKVVDCMKYLGLSIYCDRSLTIKAAKSKCNKFLGYVKGKVQA